MRLCASVVQSPRRCVVESSRRHQQYKGKELATSSKTEPLSPSPSPSPSPLLHSFLLPPLVPPPSVLFSCHSLPSLPLFGGPLFQAKHRPRFRSFTLIVCSGPLSILLAMILPSCVPESAPSFPKASFVTPISTKASHLLFVFLLLRLLPSLLS